MAFYIFCVIALIKLGMFIHSKVQKANEKNAVVVKGGFNPTYTNVIPKKQRKLHPSAIQTVIPRKVTNPLIQTMNRCLADANDRFQKEIEKPDMPTKPHYRLKGIAREHIS